MGTKRIQVILPAGIATALRALAEKEDRSDSAMVRLLVREALEARKTHWSAKGGDDGQA